LFNAVKSIYINKDENYQASEVGQFTSSAFLAADTPSGEASANFKRVLELRYPFTTSQTTAQRLQRISLNHQRQATTIDLITSLEFMKAQPNDWIYLTNSRLGYVNKTFEIQNMSMTFLENDGQIFAATSLSLQEIDTTVFGFVFSEYSTPQDNADQSVIGEVDISPPTIGTPIQITNVEGQTAKINIKVLWTNAVDSAIQGTEIQFKKSTEADSLYVTATLAGRSRTTAEISNVTVGVTYNIRVRHFSYDNVYSVYSSVANITITQPDTITNPTNLGVTTDKPFNIQLSWTNPANTNMRAVDVHFGTTTSYTPSTSNLIGTYYGDIGKKKTVLLGRSHGLDYGTNYYFKIRAVNIYGSVVEDGSGNPVYVTSPAGKMVRATTVDVENLNATVITAGTIDADNITVNNLGANNATVSNLTLTAAADSSVRAGKSSYEDATTAGFFLGFTNPQTGSRVEGIYIGTATNGMRYDTAGGLVVSGSISATTGFIGGFEIDTNSITDVADSFGLSSAVTGGDDIRFYAGATLANKANAPFRVTEAGVLTASSGTIGGITLGADKIHTGTGTFNNANTGIYIDDSGQFSLKNKLSFTGTTLAIDGNITANELNVTNATVTGSFVANNLPNLQNMNGAITGGQLNDNAKFASFFRFTRTSGTSVAAPSDSDFETEFGRAPLENDQLVVTNTAPTPDTQAAYLRNASSAWVSVSDFIAGNLIVDGTIGANQIAADAITANKIDVTNLAAINANMGTITAGSISSNLITGDVTEVYPIGQRYYTDLTSSAVVMGSFSLPAPTNGIAKRNKVDLSVQFRVENAGQTGVNTGAFIKLEVQKKSKGQNATEVTTSSVKVVVEAESIQYQQLISIAGNQLDKIDLAGGVAANDDASGTYEPASMYAIYYDAVSNKTFMQISAFQNVFSTGDDLYYDEDKFASSGTWVSPSVSENFFIQTPEDYGSGTAYQSFYIPFKMSYGQTTTASNYRVTCLVNNAQSNVVYEIRRAIGTLENIS